MLSFVGAGCTSGTVTKNMNQAATPSPSVNSMAITDENSMNQNGDGNSMMSPSVVQLAGNRISLDNATLLKPGTVTLSFVLYGRGGNELSASDLKTEQTKKIHLLLVRDDMTGYQHIHPEYIGKKWTVTTTVPNAGQYQLYFGIEPVKEKSVILRLPVTIGGATQNKNFPVPNSTASATSGGYVAALQNASS